MLHDVQCVISYIRFGLFVDIKKEEWSTKISLDKFGRVYFVFVSSKFAVTCHEYIFVDNRFEICI